MEHGRNFVHDQLKIAPCPDCQEMPIGGINSRGNWVVRCRNPAHINAAEQATEKRALEQWNEWCFTTQRQRSKINQKDDFWFLRLRADVLKCCGNPDNLDAQKKANGTTTAICRKCGRTHHMMHSEPGMFGMRIR